MTTRYQIIQGDNLDELTQRVNLALDLGHTLVGGINFDRVNRPYQAATYEIAEQKAVLLQQPTKKGKQNGN